MNKEKEVAEDIVPYLLEVELGFNIDSDDVDTFKSLMNDSIFSALPKNFLDTKVFNHVYLKDFDKILKYLIFEYQIKEEYSLNLIQESVKPLIKKMFEARRLSQKLNAELKNRNEDTNKKLKI